MTLAWGHKSAWRTQGDEFFFSIWTKPRRSAAVWRLFIFSTFRAGRRVYCGQWNWAKIVIVCRRVFRVRGDLSPPVELLMVFQRFYTHRGQEIYCPHHLPGHVFNTTTRIHIYTRIHIHAHRDHGLLAHTRRGRVAAAAAGGKNGTSGWIPMVRRRPRGVDRRWRRRRRRCHRVPSFDEKDPNYRSA